MRKRSSFSYGRTKPNPKGMRSTLLFVGAAIIALLALVVKDCSSSGRTVVGPDRVKLQTELTAQALDVQQAAARGELYELARKGGFRGPGVHFIRMAVVPASTDDEDQPYAEAVKAFTEQTGIEVELDYYDDLWKIPEDRYDVIAYRNYNLLQVQAKKGRLLDVRTVLGEDTLRKRYDSAWLDMAMLPGKDGTVMAGVWQSYTPRLGIYYARDNFDAAGFAVPASWAQLIDLSDRIASLGEKPWCIGAGMVETRATLAKYWLQAVLLRMQPLQAAEDLLFDEPVGHTQEIRQAYEQIASILDNEQYTHSIKAISSTAWSQAAASALAAEPPECWMYLDVDLTDQHFPTGSKYGVDYDWFPLPAIKEGLGQPQILRGELITITSNRPAAAALLDYFTRSESMRPWLDDAYSLSPHKDASQDLYARPFKRDLVERSNTAGSFWVDLFERSQSEQQAFLEKQAGLYAIGGLAAIPAYRTGTIRGLMADGSIGVSADGAGIAGLEVNFENLLSDVLTVEVPAGTYFVAGDSSLQSMVIRNTLMIEINPGEMLGKLLDAACAEMGKDVPNRGARFKDIKTASGELGRLMAVVDQADPEFAVAQAAVWIVTDDPRFADFPWISGLTGTNRLISFSDAAQAMRLVDQAGVDITRCRIWADRSEIAQAAGQEFVEWIHSK